MTSVGVMASAVHIAGSCTDLLSEPFNNLSAWTASGFSIVAGRTGTAARSSGSTASLLYPLPNVSTLTLGFAWRVTDLSVARPLFRVQEGASDLVSMRVETTGAITFLQGSTGVLGTSAAGLITVNTWAYIELQVVLADVGSAVVRLNGTPVLTLPSVDTRPGSTLGVASQLSLRGAGSGANSDFDDLYISTGAGCAFKGDQVIP